jgi:3-dehydroquinate synthase
MQSINANVSVSFRYDVHFTTDLFDPANTLLLETVLRDKDAAEVAHSSFRPVRVLFAIDESVEKFCPLVAKIHKYFEAHSDKIALCGEPMLLPGGERIKNEEEHVQSVQQAVNDRGLDRHSYIAAIGGGALLDAVGYAAATSHRGVRLLRVPTTTLSQDDSGVGVKNAINAFGKKNFIGTFAPPWAVLNDFRFLETLPDREWRGGISEAVKVGLIKDAEFFSFLEENAFALAVRDMSAMQPLVRRSAEIHVQHICNSGDAFEMGSSRPLDFGHWAAHKLEQLTSYKLHHGEAVAIGIALDVTYSHLMGFLDEAGWKRVLQVLADVGFELEHPMMNSHLDDLSHPECLFAGLREFREHLGGQLTITLLRGIGDGFDVHEIDEATMIRALHLLEETWARIKDGERVTETAAKAEKRELAEVAA